MTSCGKSLFAKKIICYKNFLGILGGVGDLKFWFELIEARGSSRPPGGVDSFRLLPDDEAKLEDEDCTSEPVTLPCSVY